MNGKLYRSFAIVTALALMLALVPLHTASAATSELFFSEYIEGSSNNKALEIYNGTGAPVDLAGGGYKVQMFFNGSPTAALTINLLGTVATGDVFVLAQASAAAEILAQADQVNSSGWFNGDDAVALLKGTTIIDVIGQIGFDPGSEWGTDVTSTADNTLSRKSYVCAGDLNGADIFDPSLEWDGYATNTFTGLGAYTAACGDVFLSVGDVTLYEGNEGTTTFAFNVNLSGPAKAGGVTFDIATADGTASSLDDYVAQSLTAQTIPAGSSTYTFNVAVNGDTVVEPNETFFVNITNVTGGSVSNAQAVGTIRDEDSCQLTYTPIYQIQGSGSSAALQGIRTTQGVVVGDFEGSGAASGFYLQDATGDGDPATSDGIFVFTGSADTVSVGQLVRVTGYARERFNQTALNGSNSNAAAVPAANIVSCGTGSVSPTLVNLPFASTTGPERFEGMLVQLPQPLVISEYFNYDRFGEIVLALPLDGESRAFTSTAIDEPGAPAQARALANTLSRITLDDVNSSQNPAMLRHPDGGIFALDHSFRGGDIVQNTVGVLGYDFSLYRIFPTQGADYAAVNPRPAAPEPVGGRLRVAAMNTLNYFLTPDNIQDDSGGDNPADNICGPIPSLECRGWDANQPDELLRQRAKLLATLAGLDADIIGLNELENTIGVEPVANIVSGLNDTLGAGTYAYIDTGVIGTDAIRVGMIYKPGIVTPVGDFKLLTSAVDPRFIDTRSRPVLAQTFEENATGARFTLAVNHFKSKGSACTGDPDTGDGQGNCNQTRKAAAQALVDWLATDPTGSGDADYLIMGDLNSYAMEDPIDVIKAGPDDVAGTYDDYTNLIAKYQGPYAYSYVFDGQAGYLDHALASATLVGQVIGAADWHIDADEPDVLDYDTSFKPDAQDALFEPLAYRASDHDPVVVGLDLAKYNFEGFFPPVLNPPAINLANSGSRQAFKFSLTGDWGLDVFAAGYPRSVQIDCASRSVMGSSEPLATTLTYDPLTGEYVFVWKTAKNIWTGTCRRMNMVLDDGSIHPADFQFTK